MKDKETWIEDTLHSLDGVRRATCNPDIFEEIPAESIHPPIETVQANRPFYWSVAAGIAVLIALNIFGMLYHHRANNHSGNVSSSLSADYLSYLGPIKL
ncbi:MAG: hypothetical protein NT040_17585 [Bacteroidetes bacterium]|nr:hypothetical protein [Bacteroidota bacterium]